MKELFCECVLLRSYNIDAIDALIYCRVTKYVLYSKVWDSMYISMVTYKHNIRGINFSVHNSHDCVNHRFSISNTRKKSIENLKKKGYNLDGMLLIVLTATPW